MFSLVEIFLVGRFIVGTKSQRSVWSIFGRPFLKRFALCYQTVVCLPVTLVYCRQMLRRIKMTWRACRPRPWPHCVRWRPSSPTPKAHSPPIFGPYPLRPNGCIDQDATWYNGGRPRPRRLCDRWGPRSPPQKGGRAPNFRPMFIVAKRLDESRWYLALR